MGEVTAPRITVALPVRNGANYLAAALDSILAQTMPDFDLVVSDNESTDETGKILAEYCARDARVRVSRSDRMLPLGQNMNRAVRLARTEWVKLFCHDDIMRADCLEQVVGAIEAVRGRDFKLIGNGDRHLFQNGYIAGEVTGSAREKRDGREVVRKFLDGTIDFALPAVTTAAVNLDAFEAAGGFDERFEHFDTFFWLRLLMTTNYVLLPDTLTTIRVHDDQVTSSSRQALRWANDYRTFLSEFTAEYGEALQLSPLVKLRSAIRPANIGAKSLVREMRAGRWGVARSMLGKLPVQWFPVLPPLLLRAWIVERRRSAALAGAVTPDIL